jgi:hypothetical protein
MSTSGRRALQGFTYQAFIALDWLVEMVYQDREDPIEVISVDSVGLLDADQMPKVDDIVVRFESGKTLYVQAKKGQTDRKSWSLGDATLKKELRSACEQLEEDENGRVRFCSRDPFGEVHKLAEDCRTQYPNYDVFEAEAPATLSDPLERLSEVIERTEKETFEFIQRVDFESTDDIEDIERELVRDLRREVSDPEPALNALRNLLTRHITGLTRSPRHEIERDHVVQAFEDAGVRITPERPVEDILDAFESGSRFGRSWKDTIDGEHIPRQEVGKILELIQEGKNSILVEGRPGSGKTCVLLDLVDRIEEESDLARLFIKGDRFTSVSSLSDLAEEGLPEDIPGQCARLAQEQQVVVILDALDVLSLNRHHKALKVFLGLIEQLSPIPNVTTVAACRTFDLEYDPQLRGVEWDASITVDPLDFDDQVAPLLEKWNVDPNEITESLKDTLRIPQHLDLYAKIAKMGRVQGVQSVYQLQERFLQEVIVKDDELGEEALDALQKMASRLVNDRSQSLPRSAFDGSEAVIQRLVSQEVLSEPTDGQFTFAHQTLGDNLAIREPISREETLQEFIRDHPPLPFIRPAVRSFFFYLRANQPDQFRRQVWTVLDDDDIAYHLRRLVVESLSELQPTEQDWRLLRRLFNQHEDLFRRFFDRVQSHDWVDFLRGNWFSQILHDPSDDSWALRFVKKLAVLCPQYTDEAVALWQRALNEGWEDQTKVAGEIVEAMSQAPSLDGETVGLKSLLQQIVRHIEPDHLTFEYELGPLLSEWIEETDQGDEVLWEYITKDVEIEDSGPRFSGLDIELYLHFHRDEFFKERLIESNDLISTVIDEVEEWGATAQYDDSQTQLRRGLLQNTSWDDKRSDRDIRPAYDLSLVLRDLEEAITERCDRNDEWWQKNEPRLRSSSELALRYMTVEAYRKNPEENLEGIKEQICDTELHLYSDFNHEIGRLMQEAYPHLDRSTRRQNQRSILALRDQIQDEDDEGLSSSWAKIIYDCLNRIPPCYRAPRTQDFLAEWESTFDTSHSGPKLRSWGGTVGLPVSPKRLLHLSSSSLIRLFEHFENINRSYHSRSEGLRGGREMLQRALESASSLAPKHFIEHLPLLRASDLDAGYVQSLCRGVGKHTRHRFGNLSQDEDWQPKELPDREELSRALLRMAETYRELWEDGHTIKRVIDACSDVAESHEYASRLVVLIFRLLKNRYRDSDDIDSEQRAKHASLNHVHGSASGSAIKLWQQIHSTGEKQPELLEYLLEWCAKHSNLAARIALLRRLPYLVQENPELGWRLFDSASEDAPAFFWPIAEQTLYYNYYGNFDRVEHYLDRIENEALDEAGETHGRIMTLSHLAGHVSQDDLFEKLESTNACVRKGAAQVFTANLDSQQGACISGAIRLLQFEDLSEDTWSVFPSRCFREENFQYVTKDLVQTIIHAFPAGQDQGHFYRLTDWIAKHSKTDPRGALDVTESVIDCIEEEQIRFALRPDVMAEALLSILREADEFGEEVLVRRTLSLQDRLLKLDVSAIDRMLDDASREW